MPNMQMAEIRLRYTMFRGVKEDRIACAKNTFRKSKPKIRLKQLPKKMILYEFVILEMAATEVIQVKIIPGLKLLSIKPLEKIFQ